MSDIKSVNIRGLLDTYEFPCKLPGSGLELMIKPITTGQMKKILAYENEVNSHVVEKALDRLITDCVLTEGFDISKLYLQDRFYLLVELRKVTKGNLYNFTWKCHKCSVENIASVDISKMKVDQLKPSDNVIVINDRLKFEVDYPTRADQQDAINRVKDKPMSYREKQIEIQTGTFVNSIKRVHTPEGIFDDIPFDDKMYILDNVVSDVFQVFTNWFTDNDFGIEFKGEMSCVACGSEKTVDVPLNDFFI